MVVFIRSNYLFLIASVATFVSIVWFLLAPDFEPVVTSLLGLITCVSLRPKDWMFISQRSIRQDLPKEFYNNDLETKAGFIYDNVVALNEDKNQFKFGWGKSSLDHQDKSVEFKVPKPSFSKSDGRTKIKVRVVMSTLHNTYGEGLHYLYVYIPDKAPVCFYQFEGHSAEMTVVDIDNDGFPELIVGYKCGAHSEGIRVYKFDRELNFYFIEGSDIGSDFPLITWGIMQDETFFINSYSRNWETDREKYDSIYEKYVVKNSQFTLDSTSKVKWKD
ncbi:MAG: hypothetical protein KA770_05200 [Shewanella sp.]|jgi:hypothetical protein|nr:hypothetical protein [Shewanella sp.]